MAVVVVQWVLLPTGEDEDHGRWFRTSRTRLHACSVICHSSENLTLKSQLGRQCHRYHHARLCLIGDM